MIGFFLAAVLAATAGQTGSQWPLGVEREVDEGVYMRVAAVDQGWRIWRIETRDGIRCQAVKSARGRPHPVPVGVGSALYGGTPYLTISRSYRGDGFDYSWYARHYGRVRVKYRSLGERFWTEPGGDKFDAVAVGERTIDVVLTSWEYPEIYVGYSEESAIFDLGGLGWALDAVQACEVPVNPAPQN